MKDRQQIEKLNLETIMSERFSRYSKSIIQQRALPDVRDGLKPVQRRLLYAMNKDNNTYDKAFRKSAKSIGNVMGNFHPHGDSSIYEALTRLSQEWKLKNPLIEMHGNNGSMDGDPAAAMRYTEARLSKIAGEMLRDIDKDTVHWVLNFDDTEYEPEVLPSRFPNLLVNGATGISSGYATELPPHNLGEVIDALVYLQKHSDATLNDLMQFIKGPDFPTGGIVQGLSGIKKAYQTGRGKIAVRSRTKIEDIRGNKKQIVVSEIPYDVNKLQLVKQIDEISLNKKIDGIADVRDDSDRNGLSIVVELKRNVDAKGILNYLFKNTNLQISYNFNMVAINHMRPERLSLKTILQSYLDFQRSVVKSRTQFDLKKAINRKEIVNGLIKVVSILPSVIQTIRNSQNKTDARNNLMKEFSFSKRQADSIVTLQLYRLTNTDVSALEKEQKQLEESIDKYNSILDDSKILDQVLRRELNKIKKEYSEPRKTKIENKIENLEISQTVTVPDESVMVLVSYDGYLKRSSLRSYKASDLEENGLKIDDHPIFIQKLNTRDHLFMFTNKGHLIYRPVHEIVDARWKDTGEHISQNIGLDDDEQIIAIQSSQSLKLKGSFMIATNDGDIKLTEFKKLVPGRNYKRHATVYEKCNNEDSRVVSVTYVPEETSDKSVLLMSKNGYATRYSLDKVSTSGPKSKGVRSMDLKDDDLVSNAQIVSDDTVVAMITNRGAYKQINVSDIPLSHNRGGRGIRAFKLIKSNPHQLMDFIPVQLERTDHQLKLYTEHRRAHDIVPDNYQISSLSSNGSNIMDPKLEGIPNSFLY